MNKLQALLTGEVEPGLYRFVHKGRYARLCHDVTQANWRCFGVDGRAVTDKASFLQACAAALKFPDSFGHNWDALEDSLNDLSWLELEDAKGFIIIIDDADHFAKAQPDEWAIARDVLAGAVLTRRRTGPPLNVLLRGASAIAASGLEEL
jgi:hypothetical protein